MPVKPHVRPASATIPENGLTIPAERTVTAAEKEIGKRLANIRRERGVTQAELAKKLATTQTTVSDYERGRLRLHGHAIVEIAKTLGVSSDEILGLKTDRRNGAIRNRSLVRRLQNFEKLPKRDQQALLRTIDAFLLKAS